MDKTLVVVMYTDIEKSMSKWETYPEAMQVALQQHDDILLAAIAEYHGQVLRHRGDGISAIFTNGDAIACAIVIQQRFADTDWGEIGNLRIRVALDVGEAVKHTYDGTLTGQSEEYFGNVMNRAARILDTGSGGQILLSRAMTELFKLPPQATIQDLGKHRLKDLNHTQQIFGLAHPALPQQQFPPLKSLANSQHNLSEASTTFIGRTHDLDILNQQLNNSDYRLITLIGPGGMGKTRLAQELARQQIGKINHGVFFVDLTVLETAEGIETVIANSIDFRFSDSELGNREQLLNYLQAKTMLLVLDNFEHIIEGVDLVDEMLTYAPNLKLIVTSRVALNLDWEWQYPLQGLAVPSDADADLMTYESIELFVERAQRVKRTFRLSDEPAVIVKLCQLLEGLPLAIELAAGWIRLIPCQEILDEVQRNLDFLISTKRTQSERHFSLRAVFEYSWRLLSPQHQQALMKLAIFQGHFSRVAAETVAGTNLPILAMLVDQSLLYPHDKRRYRLQELIRQFLQEKLVEADQQVETQARHAAYFMQHVATLTPIIKSAKQLEAHSQLENDFADILQAWHYSIEHQQFDLLELAVEGLYLHTFFGQFYKMRLFSLGLALFSGAAEQLYPTTSTQALLVARLWAYASEHAQSLNRKILAKTLAEKGYAIWQEHGEPDAYLDILVIYALTLDDSQVDRQIECYQRCMTYWLETDDLWRRSFYGLDLPFRLWVDNQPELISTLFQEICDYFQRLQHPWGMFYAENIMLIFQFETSQIHFEALIAAIKKQFITTEHLRGTGFDVSLYEHLMFTYQLANRMEEAASYADQAEALLIQLGSDTTRFKKARFDQALHQENYIQAATLLNPVIKAYQQQNDVENLFYAELAWVYLQAQQGKYSEALAKLSQLETHHDPRGELALIFLKEARGKVYWLMGDYSQAVAMLEEACDLAKTVAWHQAYNWLGYLYLLIQNPQAAINLIQSVPKKIAWFNNLADRTALLAVAYEQIGEHLTAKNILLDTYHTTLPMGIPSTIIPVISCTAPLLLANGHTEQAHRALACGLHHPYRDYWLGVFVRGWLVNLGIDSTLITPALIDGVNIEQFGAELRGWLLEQSA